MRRLLVLLLATSGCAATIELTEHQRLLGSQEADYEKRLQRCEEDKQALTAARAAAEEAGKKTAGEADLRIKQLESSLADKGRLLDDVTSQLVELQSAFSKLSASQRRKLTAKSKEERHLSAQLDRVNKRFSDLLQAEIAAGGVVVQKESRALLLRFEDGSLFARGSGRLNKEAKPLLTKLAQALIAEKDVALEIGVHTDNVQPKNGTFRDTWALTGQQGLVFVRELQRNGVDPSRLGYVSRGQFKPRSTNDTKEGRGQNRRIELRLLVR